MINAATYAEYRAMLDAHEAWRDGRASYRTEDVPEYLRKLTNEMRSAIEVYELHRDKPERFTAYVSSALPFSTTETMRLVTTFTGDQLGRVVEQSVPWRDKHGNPRWQVRVRADWGGIYTGQTAGAGMYVNLRRIMPTATSRSGQDKRARRRSNTLAKLAR